ncbi:MAG: glycosyltransferase [Nitrospiraceae bacterium]|nr:MAG: glycosyltransferase [Nitrospiraceae bacterium]
MKILALISDAYGGRGGIALYNRNFLRALCEHPQVVQVIAIPRVITYDPEEALPSKLRYLTEATGSKLNYLGTCLKVAARERNIDLIICGHLHLLPFAFLFRSVLKAPVLPIVYGVEAWNPTQHRSANFLCRKLDAFISIRTFTAQQFIEWAGIDRAKYYYLPNCIEESRYGVAPKRSDLQECYGIKNRTVIMTAGRLDTVDMERNKGFDEVLEVLPELREEIPDIVYLIMGDGDDSERLAHKARFLGVEDIVRFTGYIPERDKADHYRLADVFAMPGSNRHFDRYPFRFVFLEALACGVPVVGCRLEDKSEAHDPCANQLIIQVDPNSKEDIKRGILSALKQRAGHRTGIENFYYPAFKSKVHDIINNYTFTV